MGHEDKGHFAKKHKDRQINEPMAEKLKHLAHENTITCASAHQAATSFNQSPSEIGVQIDLLEYRITNCQTGLFGYSDGQKKFNPDIVISSALNQALDQAATDGRISCRQTWDIATRLKIKKLDVGSACEKKKIKIKPCQLGSF